MSNSEASESISRNHSNTREEIRTRLNDGVMTCPWNIVRNNTQDSLIQNRIPCQIPRKSAKSVIKISQKSEFIIRLKRSFHHHMPSEWDALTRRLQWKVVHMTWSSQESRFRNGSLGIWCHFICRRTLRIEIESDDSKRKSFKKSGRTDQGRFTVSGALTHTFYAIE
jgi:hypothetical protein